MKTSGDKIRELITAEGLSQREFAKKVDIPYSTLCKIINNYNNPSLWTLGKIADTFGIELETLFGEEEHRIASNIGERIQILRTNVGLSQERLAQKAGISVKTVDNLENNRNTPRINTLMKIESVFYIRSESMDTTGDRIQRLIKERNLRKVELARRTGLSISTIRKIETNRCAPSPYTARKLAEVLEIDIKDLYPTESNESITSIGGVIQKARKEKGITIEELARKSGVSHATIGKAILDQIIPKKTTLEKIAKALEIDVSELIP